MCKKRNFEELMRTVDKSLTSQILDGDEISSQIDEIASRISSVKQEIENVAEENMRAERHNTRLSVIQEQTEGV